MRYPVKIFTATMIAMTLLTQISYAQPIPGLSPKEKAQLEQKQAHEKDTDRAYKSTLDRIPDASKNADPWGSLRAPSAPSSAGTK
jgi:hypothetical protein